MNKLTSLCKKTPKYFVILIFDSVIYFSKLLRIKNFESLVFRSFLSKTQKIGIFLLTLTTYILLISSFFSLSLTAQERKVLSNPEKFKTELKVQAKETSSIIASFKQEKHLSFMKEPQYSEGVFYYEKANKMRWEQNSPTNYVMLINEETVRIKENGKEKNIKGANKMMSKINTLMLGLVNGDIIEDKSFTTNYFYTDSHYIIQLIPNQKRLQSIFNSIELTFSKTTTRLKVLTFYESADDKSVINFFDEKFNQPIKAALFLNL